MPKQIPDPDIPSGGERFGISIDDSAGFVDWWQDNIEDRFGLAREQVVEILLTGLPDDCRLEFYRYGSGDEGNFVQLSITGTSLTETVYLFGQTIHLAPNPIENLEIDVMDVVRTRQKTGISATLMENVLKLADAMSIVTLTVEAYLSAGPYVWLNYGFVPDAAYWDEIREKIASKVVELQGGLPVETLDVLGLVLASDHPRSLQGLLSERMLVESVDADGTRRTVPLIVALMADTAQRWYGTLDLHDRVSRSCLADAIRRNRR